MFVDGINIFDCRLSGVILSESYLCANIVNRLH